MFNQQSPPFKGKNEGGRSLSGFVDDAFANVAKSIDVTFALDAKDKSLSRLRLIEEDIICKPAEVCCEDSDQKYCGGRIGRKKEKICLQNAALFRIISSTKPIGAVRKPLHHQELMCLQHKTETKRPSGSIPACRLSSFNRNGIN